MATKFGEFLKTKKIDSRRILLASAKLERHRYEDRVIKLKQSQARSAEDGKRDDSLPKPRSGRPVTDRAISAAVVGKRLSGAAKTRLLRAVNHLLEQKKQEAVDLRALFDFPVKGGKKEESKDASAES